jgi:hypothetical protein
LGKKNRDDISSQPKEGKMVAMVTKTKKPEATLWLRDIPPDKVFWFHDGRIVKNVGELAKTLREMPAETFHYHVAGDKNDFSNWVGDFTGDVTLANQLQKTNAREATARRGETRLDWLRARL